MNSINLMRVVFYTNSVSPHQLPLAQELVKRIGAADYRYVYTQELSKERKRLGWAGGAEEWIVYQHDRPQECREWLETCEVLICGLRDFPLFARRAATRRKTIYASERWFKPIPICVCGIRLTLPGWIRLLHLQYLGYARKIARLMSEENNQFCYYPMGVWAQRDMELICRMFGVSKQNYGSKMKLWGYFVAPSQVEVGTHHSTERSEIRILWVGRMIHLKRVDTLIRAVASLPGKVTLNIYGTGPKKWDWERLATRVEREREGGSRRIMFHDAVSIDEVRRLMREHDIYVLSSNGEEGWGATLNEAIEEKMRVIGTYEAGASATMLPESNLYHAGDWRALAQLLETGISPVSTGRWTPVWAAEKLIGELS